MSDSCYYYFDSLTADEQDLLRATIRDIRRLSLYRVEDYYILDLQHRNIVYASPSSQRYIGGFCSEGQMSYDLVLSMLSPEHRAEIKASQRSALRFLRRECRARNTRIEDYILSYEIPLQQRGGELYYTHSLKGIVADESGKIRFVLCRMSLSSYRSGGHMRLVMENDPGYYYRELGYGRWVRKQSIGLTEQERLLAMGVLQGATEKELALLLGITVYRVKQIKRAMVAKFKAVNAVQAAYRIIQVGLL